MNKDIWQKGANLISPIGLRVFDYNNPIAFWDFANGHFNDFTFTRASNATVRNSLYEPVVVGSNVPRFDSDVNGNTIGLLLEPSRTNYFLNSSAPVTQSITLSNGSYTLWIEGDGSVDVAANTATISGAGTATEGTKVTFTVSSAGSVDFTITGDVTRVQVENGAYVTSYIPVVGTAVSRASDVCTFTLSNINGIDKDNFSLGLVIRPRGQTASSGGFIIIQNGSNNNDDIVIIMGGSDRQMDGRIYSGGGAQTQFAPSNIFVIDQTVNIFFGYTANSTRAFVNGTATGAEDTSLTTPSAISTLRLGDATGYWGGAIGCWIERLYIFNKRLSDAELQGFSL